MNMGAPGSEFQPCFAFDAVITPRPDGAWLVRAGRPRPVEDRVTVKEAAKILNYSVDQTRRIMREHFLPYQRRKNCKMFITRQQLEQLRGQRVELN